MSEKKKIVIADDEPFILSALQDTLSDDYTVFSASNGKEAVALVGKTMPDLAILDVMMPEMDGLEACKVLKKDSSTKSVPVILLTAKGQITDIEKGFKSGADAYVVKPFSPARLMEKVEEIFEKVQMRKKIIEDKKKA
ncbi:MAG: two-component system response regulator [Candidatus Goldiibacteriota bacterium HGW-Goldbacteria-1]|jgi:two-component system alkaline phosphatase synthesis response regulator PhoP|nr:MAG: two-component system response regulator [Candidatus Goldiibacteriota bacterium HGW-Goldbacteria-1]